MKELITYYTSSSSNSATAADTFLYGYVPSRAVGYVYVVIFALTSCAFLSPVPVPRLSGSFNSYVLSAPRMAGGTVTRMVANPISTSGEHRRARWVVGTTAVEFRSHEQEPFHYSVGEPPSPFACHPSDVRCRTILLVLAPTPLVAALFIGFGRIVDRMGSQYSRLKPSLCTSQRH